MEIIFFNSRTERFYNKLDKSIQAHVDDAFDMLEEKSYTLGLPISRALGSGLFELRIIDLNHIRFIYTFHDDKILMLHGFVKKSNKILKQDLDYAKNERKRLLREYNR